MHMHNKTSQVIIECIIIVNSHISIIVIKISSIQRIKEIIMPYIPLCANSKFCPCQHPERNVYSVHTLWMIKIIYTE